ncbi:MAG: hypothetical protein QM758_01620 [Armatimonas sp.]
MSMSLREENAGERLGYGIVTSIGFAIYGAVCLFRQEIMLGRRGSRYLLTGPGAIAAGITLLCVGAYLHFYFYYRDRDEERFRRLHFAGSIISGTVGGLGLITFLYFLMQQGTP